jgi:hypothetical protein
MNYSFSNLFEREMVQVKKVTYFFAPSVQTPYIVIGIVTESNESDSQMIHYQKERKSIAQPYSE